MKKYAIIDSDNNVTNIVIYDMDFEFEAPGTHQRVDITGKRGVNFGDIYDPATGNFTKK